MIRIRQGPKTIYIQAVRVTPNSSAYIRGETKFYNMPPRLFTDGNAAVCECESIRPNAGDNRLVKNPLSTRERPVASQRNIRNGSFSDHGCKTNTGLKCLLACHVTHFCSTMESVIQALLNPWSCHLSKNSPDVDSCLRIRSSHAYWL
jgi:hypothetical protein